MAMKQFIGAVVFAVTLSGAAWPADPAQDRSKNMAGLEGSYHLALAGGAKLGCSITLLSDWNEPDLKTLANASADKDCNKVHLLFDADHRLTWTVMDSNVLSILSWPAAGDGAPDEITFVPGPVSGQYSGELLVTGSSPILFTLEPTNN